MPHPWKLALLPASRPRVRDEPKAASMTVRCLLAKLPWEARIFWCLLSTELEARAVEGLQTDGTQFGDAAGTATVLLHGPVP